MKLSVILISYDMAREIPRTLHSLSRTYQHGAQDLAYEVLLIDNGSPEPLDEATWRDIDVPARLIRLQDASSSPARAINIALEEAVGDVVCLMIYGAHILTPGVFRMALSCYRAYENAVVAIRYFYLGVEEQIFTKTYLTILLSLRKNIFLNIRSMMNHIITDSLAVRYRPVARLRLLRKQYS